MADHLMEHSPDLQYDHQADIDNDRHLDEVIVSKQTNQPKQEEPIMAEQSLTPEAIKPRIDEKMRKALRADFPEEAYSQHPTKSFLTTLKAIYVTERLNDVFGVGRWDLQHKVENTDDGYVLMSGTLVIFDYDVNIPVQFGGHRTEGTNTEMADGYKSAVTDILSKSASYLEIGIDLFKGKIKAPSKAKPRAQTQQSKPPVKKQPPKTNQPPAKPKSEALRAEIETLLKDKMILDEERDLVNDNLPHANLKELEQTKQALQQRIKNRNNGNPEW